MGVRASSPRLTARRAASTTRLFLIDAGDHTVRKFNLDGKLSMTLGEAGKPAVRLSGDPFYGPTHVAVRPRNGYVYVSDGYSNARVHEFDPDGGLVKSWGRSGTDPGEFNTVHNIAVDAGRLGVRRRPGEPPRAGFRLRWQIRDAVGQPGDGLVPDHGPIGPGAIRRRVLRWHRRERGRGRQLDRPAAGAARHGDEHRRARCWPGSAKTPRDQRPAGSTHRMASLSTPAATCMSATSRSAASAAPQGLTGPLRSFQKLVRVVDSG